MLPHAITKETVRRAYIAYRAVLVARPQLGEYVQRIPVSSFSSISPTARSLYGRSTSLFSSSFPSTRPLCRLLSSTSNSVKEWHDFNNAGLKFLSEGKYREAEHVFISALRTASSFASDRSLATIAPLYLSLSNLSQAQLMLDNLDESKKNAQSAVYAARQLQDDIGIEVVAHMFRQLGLVCENREEWQQAKHAYTQALQLYERKIQDMKKQTGKTLTDHDREQILREHAGCLYAVGVMCEELAEENTALHYYQQAVTHAAAAYGNDSLNVAEAHVAVGKLLLKQGKAQDNEDKREAGREELMKALEIYQPKENPLLLEVLPIYLDSLKAMQLLKPTLEEARREERDAAAAKKHS